MKTTVYSNDNGIEWGVTGEERIIQNVRNILRTRKFEVPFMRGMGITPDHIDAPPNHIKTNLATDVTEAINTYESRATVLNVDIVSVDENGDYIIAVEVEV